MFKLRKQEFSYVEKQLGLHLQMNPFGEVERFKLKITNSLVLNSKWHHAEQEKETRFHSLE